jgi:hypothetical protein
MSKLDEADSIEADTAPHSERPAELTTELGPEQQCFQEDSAYARYAADDGEFADYDGYVVAVFQKAIVGKGKNPLHLRTRLAKKLGIDAWRLVLVDFRPGAY